MRSQVNTKEFELKARLARIAEIELSPAWFICDRRESEGLYMIRYREDHPDILGSWGHVRGWVIDVFTERVVCKSLRASDPIVTSQIEKVGDQYKIVNKNGETLMFDIDNTTINRGYDGVMLRVFKHNGNVYLINTRKFTIEKSFRQYNPEKTFLDMYNEVSGPDIETMFGDEKDSDYCYYLMLVHPDLLVSSKEKVENGYVVYLGYECTNPDTEQELWKPTDSLVQNKEFNLQEANKYLMWGSYTPEDGFQGDERLLPGEFVVLDYNGSTYLIQSKSYHWRYQIRDNTANLYMQFMKLVDVSIKNVYQFERYQRKYPIMPKISVKDVIENVKKDPIVFWSAPVTSGDSELDVVYNTWLCMIIAMPLSHQHVILNFNNKYRQDIVTVSRWMNSLKNDYSDPNIHKMTKLIVSKAIKNNKKIVLTDVEGTTRYQIIRNYKKYFAHQ